MPGIPISTSENVWLDVYAVTGVPVGGGITIQNQSPNALVVRYADSAPQPNDYSGYMVMPGKDRQVDAGGVGCWARCVSGVQAYVQEL